MSFSQNRRLLLGGMRGLCAGFEEMFMPKLLYSPASPYSAKVRMAAHYAGIALEEVTV